jgi:uracil-DNA glycosylase
MTSQLCPACAQEIVPPRGSTSSRILIVGEFPGQTEIEKGRPFAGPAGGVLRTELARVGLDMVRLRITNLWLHEPNKEENCFKAGYDLVLDEAKGKDAILMVGSEVVSAFTEYNVMAINGLRLDKSDHPFSASIVFACLNPAIVFHKSYGEVRFAITEFEKYLKSEGIE